MTTFIHQDYPSHINKKYMTTIEICLYNLFIVNKKEIKVKFEIWRSKIMPEVFTHLVVASIYF